MRLPRKGVHEAGGGLNRTIKCEFYLASLIIKNNPRDGGDSRLSAGRPDGSARRVTSRELRSRRCVVEYLKVLYKYTSKVRIGR